MPPAPSSHMDGTITCAVAAFGTVIVALVQLWNTDVIWSQKCLVRPVNTDCTSCCEAYAANHWTPQMIIGICSLIMFTKRLVLALYRDVFWDGVVMRMLSFAVFDSACAIFYSSYASDGVVLANLVTMSTLALFVAILCGASTALGGDQVGPRSPSAAAPCRPVALSPCRPVAPLGAARVRAHTMSSE